MSVNEEINKKVLQEVRNNIEQGKYPGLILDVSDQDILDIIKYQPKAIAHYMKSKEDKIKLEILGSFKFMKNRENISKNYIQDESGRYNKIEDNETS